MSASMVLSTGAVPRVIPPPPSTPPPSTPIPMYGTKFVQRINWVPVTGQYTPPTMIPNVMSIRVPLDGLPDSHMPVVIGAQGSVFKAITHKTRAHYIWWDKKNREVEVWGLFKNAWEAAARIKQRLDMVRNLPYSQVVSVPIVKLPDSLEEYTIPEGIKWGDLPCDF